MSETEMSAGTETGGRPRLIFHIGHHKTGSTAIQEALASGRIAVEGARLQYPARFNHNYLSRHVDVFDEKGTALQGEPGRPGLAALARQLQAGGADHFILSGENFESTAPARLHRVMQRFLLPHAGDHAVLCYVRPHAQRILSSFAETVKIGRFQGDPTGFYHRARDTGRFFYAPQLASWQAEFGAHFHARPMLRELMEGGSVVRDFARLAFGPEAVITVTEAEASNESLCLEDLLLVAVIQQQLAEFDLQLRHTLGWSLAIALNARRRHGPGTRLALHRSLAEDIRRSYLEDARALDRGIFAATPVMEGQLDHAVDTALDQPQSFAVSDYFTPDELRTTATLVGLVADLLRLDPKAARAHLHGLRLGDMLAPRPAAAEGGKKGAGGGKGQGGKGQGGKGQGGKGQGGKGRGGKRKAGAGGQGPGLARGPGQGKAGPGATGLGKKGPGKLGAGKARGGLGGGGLRRRGPAADPQPG